MDNLSGQMSWDELFAEIDRDDPQPTGIALRHQLAAYDAIYVAMAEATGATLVTRDARLARATGHRARIEVA